MLNNYCNCSCPNCSCRLPKVDGSTLKLWAETFGEKVKKYVELYKQYGSVRLQDIRAKNHPFIKEDLVNRGEYDIHNFLCDSFIGDLPWTPKENAAVTKILCDDPSFVESVKYLNPKFEIGVSA